MDEVANMEWAWKEAKAYESGLGGVYMSIPCHI